MSAQINRKWFLLPCNNFSEWRTTDQHEVKNIRWWAFMVVSFKCVGFTVADFGMVFVILVTQVHSIAERPSLSVKL